MALDRGGSARSIDKPTQNRENVDLADIVVWCWRNRIPILSITLICGIAAVSYSLLQPASFTATVSFLPQGDSPDVGLLSKVASFTGMRLDTEVSYEQLYGEIILSESILGKVIDRFWSHRDHEVPVSLYEILDVGDREPDGDYSRIARAEVLKKLRTDIVEFFRDDRSGFMLLRVTIQKDPSLAAAMANFLAHQLDEFNQEYRSRQAEEQLRIVEAQLAEAQSGLKTANDDLTSYITSNRTYAASPALQQRYDELAREVQAQTTVWIELRRQLELTKIDQNKSAMSITILDEATPPVKKSGPRHSFNGLAGLVFGMVFSLLVLFALEVRIALLGRIRVSGGKG